MKRSFESLLAEGAERHIELRVRSARDPQTGNLVFVAELAEPSALPFYFLASGSVVVPIELDSFP